MPAAAAALLVLAFLALLAAAAWVRHAPSDPARWHVDPLTAARPAGPNAFLLRPEGGDAAAPVYPMPPAALARAVDAAARADGRTELLAGSVEEGFMTYLTRSRIWGFPDYSSVRVLPAEGGATLAVFARARFGRSDLGVNRARVERWLAALGPGLPRP